MRWSRHALPLVLAAAVVIAPAAASAKPAPVVRPVSTFTHATFGKVLVTRSGQALYWWNRERPGRVRCTGACARAWPPLIIPRRARVPARIAGVKGRFGTIVRRDGRRQVTYKRRPIYTYVNEGPREVRCNNVNGWFVARARGLT